MLAVVTEVSGPRMGDEDTPESASTRSQRTGHFVKLR